MTIENSKEFIPPQNLEAEMAVLGAMLIDENAIGVAIESIHKDSFYKDTHKIIFEVITGLFNESKAVDLVTVTNELKRLGSLDQVGGAVYLTELLNSVPTAVNISNYVSIVKENSTLRCLIVSCNKIISLCHNTDGKIDSVVDEAEKLIFEVAENKQNNNYTPIKEIVKESMEKIDQLYQNKAHVTGVSTGFIDFDMKTAGFQPSDLIIIAGRPSMGKSALALGMAEYAAIVNKVPTALFSLEMSKEQLVQRLLCSHAKVDANKVRTGYLAASDWPRLTAAAGKLSESPIYIDDTPAISVMELRAKARRLKASFNIQMLILDYLQLMRGGSEENRQQEISEISRSLKSLARELRLPIIALSQLSRAVESRNDHRPQLSDLRESGAIEQDADVVVMLFREEYYKPTPENQGIAEIIIAKQRNGPVGTVKLAFLNEYTRFENLAHSE